MSELESIKFRINTINILGFNFKNPVEFVKVSESLPLELKYGISYRWNIDKELFGVVLDYIYLLETDGKKEEILRLSLITEFIVDNLKKHLVVRAQNDFDIYKPLEVTLVGLAFSTGRGILFERTQGTFLCNHIVPPVSMNDLVISKKIKDVEP